MHAERTVPQTGPFAMAVAALARGECDSARTFVHRSSVDERDQRVERSTYLLSRTITLLHLNDPDALNGFAVRNQWRLGGGEERGDDAGRHSKTNQLCAQCVFLHDGLLGKSSL